MSHIAIRGDRVGKSYILGHNIAMADGNNSLREALTNGVRNFTRKTRDTFAGRPVVQGDKLEEFWALKDVSFEIRQGDRVGLIGRNGAGKSTLLKLLSRISEPTTGSISITGRVASLLEVGTGFHPELTGRENVFLNGAILGMSKAEIAKKFDEIVDFAGVERFLDTPVKRYSSGMYVRLAFAVAAHLEPEILIVDEVLAVGDAQFQKKCMGKMESVGREGRTVIFVSHSMPSITSLCDRAILLENGQIVHDGSPSESIMRYYGTRSSLYCGDFSRLRIGDSCVRLLKGAIKNHRKEEVLQLNIVDLVVVEITFEVLTNDIPDLVPNLYFYTANGECAFFSLSSEKVKYTKGIYAASCHVPGNLLNDGSYFVGLAISSFSSEIVTHFFEKDALSFNVVDDIHNNPTRSGWAGNMLGAVRPQLHWEVEKL
jgi:lipopolysaccharide transport system ATP-binding protein